MRKILIMTVALLAYNLAGCTFENSKPEYLFTQDGCKMYRYSDWYTVYFMTCPNSSTHYQTEDKYKENIDEHTINDNK